MPRAVSRILRYCESRSASSMGKLQCQLSNDFLPHPTFNRLSEFAQPSFEEMVCAFNHDQFLRLWNRSEKSLKFRPWSELVARATDEELRLQAVAEKFECISSRRFAVRGNRNRRHANSNHCVYASISTRG